MTKLHLPPLQIPIPSVGIEDIPLTPAARMFVHPELNTIIHGVIEFEHEMDTDAVKTVAHDCFMSKQQRFSCLLVRQGSTEYWKKTEVDIDRHVIAVDCPGPVEDVDRVVNDYIAELSACRPLSTDKPLWEIHVLKNTRCVILRIHHALGDGISLLALLLNGCNKLGNQPAISFPQAPRIMKSPMKKRNWSHLFLPIKHIILSLIFCLEFILRTLCIRDRRSPVSGGKGVELWPRKIATAKFLIGDMKMVKSAVPNATINDILIGVISSGLSRYLGHRSDDGLKNDISLTGVAMVNLRPQPGLQELAEMLKNGSQARWGNRFGTVLLPMKCSNKVSDPLDYVRQAKSMNDKKKRSMEAHFAYALGNLVMCTLGPKAAYLLYNRVMCNTTFTISNVMGPQEEIAVGTNRIRSIRVNTTSLPHALSMHMMSYAGRAEMQIMVAKDVIPDPEFLAKCFEDALLEMKQAAVATA